MSSFKFYSTLVDSCYPDAIGFATGSGNLVTPSVYCTVSATAVGCLVAAAFLGAVVLGVLGAGVFLAGVFSFLGAAAFC